MIFSDVADEVLRKLSSYGLAQDRVLVLSGAITDTATTITLSSVTDLGTGVIEVDSEQMYVTAVDSGTNQATVIRGFRSTAAAHSDGALVFVNPFWPRVDVENALNDAITGSYPNLFAVAEEVFSASAIENTYDLDPLTEDVLEVRTNEVDPTDEWVVLSNWRVDSNLNRLTLYDTVTPGTQFKVVSVRRPAALTSADDFTVSGLQDTAKQYAVLQACADLVAHMDGSRLPASAAAADDMEANRSVGSATRVAQFLVALAERELERERRRLQIKYPPTIHRNRGR